MSVSLKGSDPLIPLFTLLLKRADNTTVLAALKGNKYEGRIAWESLQACASAVKKPE